MNPGILDRSITLLRKTTLAQSDGFPLPDLQPFAVVHARKLDISGRDRLIAQQGSINETSTRFTIRFRADVDRTTIIEHDAQRYRITHLNELGRREFLELSAEAVNDRELQKAP